MILQDFNYWTACRGAQKSKKIEIAKNELKHPQSSVGWHIKGFTDRLGGLGYHMSQSIFPDFRRFLPNGFSVELAVWNL